MERRHRTQRVRTGYDFGADVSTGQGCVFIMLPTVRLLCLTIALIGVSSYSNATDQAIQRGTALANACAACHGPEGHSTSAIPSLTAMSASALRDSLRSFRSGERSGTVMNRLTQGLDDADIDAVAAYFAAKRRP